MLLVTAVPSETLPSLAEKNSWPERWQIFPVGNPRSLPSGFDVSLKNTLLSRCHRISQMYKIYKGLWKSLYTLGKSPLRRRVERAQSRDHSESTELGSCG